MSALGQKQTSRAAISMSALPPKAGRQLVRHGENIGHRAAQRPQPLAHRNAAREQESADLVDLKWSASSPGGARSFLPAREIGNTQHAI
jgi:hypothetical protein